LIQPHQTRAVPSSEAVMVFEPSLLKATARTAPVWPRNTVGDPTVIDIFSPIRRWSRYPTARSRFGLSDPLSQYHFGSFGAERNARHRFRMATFSPRDGKWLLAAMWNNSAQI